MPWSMGSSILTKINPAKLALAILVITILVGPNPLASSSVVDESGGSALRQAILGGGIVLSLAIGVYFHGLRAMRAVPMPFWLFFGWALLSITWSVVPDIAARRYFFSLGTTLALFSISYTLGFREVIKWLALILFLTLVVDLLAVLLLENAKHGVGEKDYSLIGLWKGVHSHKNIAASVAYAGFLCGLIGFFFHRSVPYFLMALLSVVLIVGTQSKTTMALVPVCLVFVYLLYASATSSPSRKFFSMVVIATFVSLAAYIWMNYEDVIDIITDDKFLTGRGSIWRFILAYVQDNPLGSGYGSFWNVGYFMPASYYGAIGDAAVPHGHNGYLDILATTGYVGFFLAICAFIFYPVRLVLTMNGDRREAYLVVSGLILYSVLHNLSESSLFQGERIDWMFFVISMAALARAKSDLYVASKAVSPGLLVGVPS